MAEMMTELELIDNIRKSGLRPQVVACLTNNKRLLLVYKKKHDLWQIPQGGINNKEKVHDAIYREIAEELGNTFNKESLSNPIAICEAQMSFKPSPNNKRDLKTDNGQDIDMIGKKYFFFALESQIEKVDINKTEFDSYKWVSYREGLDIANAIYQVGKRRITIKAIETLKERGFIE